VVCTSCGRTAEVGDLGLDVIADEVRSQTGFDLDSHRIELYGLCEDCRERAASDSRHTAHRQAHS
jgi:Fe2+ or Zn2+ uptake regulation protein